MEIPYLQSLAALPGGLVIELIVLFVILVTIIDLVLTVFLKIMKTLSGKTKTSLDDRVFGALGHQVLPIALVTALWVSIETVYPNIIIAGTFKALDLYIVALLGIGGLLLSATVDQLLLWYGIELRPRKKLNEEKEVFPFVRNVVKVAIVLIFVVFILQRLGFDTTAIITGLGIGGLAVALALQDTLANFFAGVHILIDKPFREEDYIKLENGVQGTVTQIGWRTTRLVTPEMNEVVVPNSKLSGSVLENFSTPRDNSMLTYSIGVAYKENVEEVELLITEALKSVASKNQLMDGNSGWVRFDAFGEYSLNFKFGYVVQGYVNRWNVLKDVNKELFRIFKKNDIEIPFPVRVVYSPEKEKKKK